MARALEAAVESIHALHPELGMAFALRGHLAAGTKTGRTSMAWQWAQVAQVAAAAVVKVPADTVLGVAEADTSEQGWVVDGAKAMELAAADVAEMEHWRQTTFQLLTSVVAEKEVERRAAETRTSPRLEVAQEVEQAAVREDQEVHLDPSAWIRRSCLPEAEERHPKLWPISRTAP